MAASPANKPDRWLQFYRFDSAALTFSQAGSRGGTQTAASHTLEAQLKLKKKALEFLSDQSGATAIEYGLIAAGISLAIIAVVNGLGSNLNTKFTDINTSLK